MLDTGHYEFQNYMDNYECIDWLKIWTIMNGFQKPKTDYLSVNSLIGY